MMTLQLLPTQRCRQGHCASALAITAVLIGLLLALALAGCGTSVTASRTSSPSASPPPGSPPAPTRLPTLDPTQLPQAGRDIAPAVRVGGLFAGTQAHLGNLTYPHVHLPEGTPLKPLHVPGLDVNPPLPSDAPTNPWMGEAGGGYMLDPRNDAPQTHRIHGALLRLGCVTPYAPQLHAGAFFPGPYTRSIRTGPGS